MKARGYPFNKKGVLCCCCIPAPLQPRLLTLQPQLKALQDLPFPLPVQSCSQRNQDTEILLWTWLFPGEHACKWLSFLLAQCKFFSVGISSGVALQHEADRGLWLRRDRNSARLNFRCMIPPRVNQNHSAGWFTLYFPPMMMMVAPHQVSTGAPQMLQPSVHRKNKNFCYQWSRERVLQGNFADKCNSQSS